MRGAAIIAYAAKACGRDHQKRLEGKRLEVKAAKSALDAHILFHLKQVQ